MEFITKVQRNDMGEIISFQTSNGRIISYQKAIVETKNRILNGVHIDLNEKGNESLVNENRDDLYFSTYPTIF
ncbi:DUF3892 domain-containing protein [Heyndrickxia sporothermodurans]